MKIIERLGAKTPKFWKRVQKIAINIVLLTNGSVFQLAVSPDKALELQKKSEQ